MLILGMNGYVSTMNGYVSTIDSFSLLEALVGTHDLSF
jgi:hypothetical protein